MDLEETWADSAQIVCFPIDEIPNKLENIIANASKRGLTIEENGSWWDDDHKVYYQSSFYEIDSDELDLVGEIFYKKFSLYCTWEPGLNNFFTDEFEENEIEGLPEEIDYKKIRLKQS